MEEFVFSQQPVETICRKPMADKKDVEDIMWDVYGLDVVSVVLQESYFDQVFYVVTNRTAPPITSEYILRLHDHEHSKELEKITEVLQVLLWLDKQGINCPTPLKNNNGEYLYLKDLSKEENGITFYGTYAVCLLRFVKGILLKNVEISDGLFFKAGKYLAQLQVTMKEVNLQFTKRDVWDFDYVEKILIEKDYYKFVKEPERRELITKAFSLFVKDVYSKRFDLPKGVIHFDFNEANILVQKSPESMNGLDQYDITGIIDFAELSYNALVYDTAIGLLYMMLMRPGDMFTAGGHFLAGYLSIKDLKDIEKTVMIKTMTARLAISLISGLENYSQNPDNSYLLETQVTGWDFLRMLLNIPEDEVWKRWNQKATKDLG